ncbi:DUF2975 domain-containing protein [Sphingopyxis witflariensis]|uniref:DUF2975 domain-containing protein n=1 Tax=Sphingopyxis witflariensis TaxID=173675 RepID=A0A246K3P5_9SPHN|nr:DUF2975 domain-containing protein [Sphingopyxis witflariensis]OWR00079.1 hypothetical protein CDQ91_04680 [Sphingopyxis witflariensis]
MKTDNRILLATRGLILLIMGLVAAGAIGLTAAALALPFYRSEVASALAEQAPALNMTTLYPPLYGAFLFGLIALGLIWATLSKLRAIVASVSEGDPFIAANSRRLKAIGWLMVAGQVAAIALGLMIDRVASLTGTHGGGSDLSLNGLLAILLVFALAGVFERGAQMREELEGTI